MRISPYHSTDEVAWNAFVAASKNATFLFHRAYMDYHADRFTDASLMIYEEDELVALFPASIKASVVSSHGGLTYGGVLTGKRMTTKKMLHIFDAIKAYYTTQKATRIIYKAIPEIYAQLPAMEDLYALFRHNAVLIRRDISSAIYMPERLPFAKGKKYNLSKARKAGIKIEKTQDYASFWSIETEVLKQHQAQPVHSLAEISQLAAAFPDNIALYGAYLQEKMVAGVLLYINQKTVHAQYMGATAEAQDCGALDAIVAHLLEQPYKDFRYFDFGISTEDSGRYLNEGLIAQKEMFGGRAVMYDHYEMSL